jgi:hypothetical protein
MSKKQAPQGAGEQPPAPTAPSTEARALVDLPAHGVRAGQLLQGEPDVIAALVADGSADAHPDAVAYAKQAAQP